MRRWVGIALAAFLAYADAGFAQSGTTDLWSRVTVYRDQWGVPHVYGQDTYAMAFGFGYAQAEDHLDPMLLAFRMVNGRAAEVLGEGYDESDQVALRMRHGELAYDALAAADDTTRALCAGFAEGIHAWMSDNPSRTPRWAEGIRPSDVLALMHYFLLSQAPFDLADAYYPAKAVPSGNLWAVGPALTKSGNAMLVMNPHADYTGPFQWYEAHLVAPGYDVYGATIFGLPVLLMGHNQFIAWGIAPNEPDTADVYIERDYPVFRDPNSVMQQPRANARPVIASVAKQYYVWNGNRLDERATWVERTPRGPVVAYGYGIPYSLAIGGYGVFGTLSQFYDMGRAENLGGFRRALARHQLPTFHVIYADRGGALFYRYAAIVGEKRDASFADIRNRTFAEQQLTPWDQPLPNAEPAYSWGAPAAYSAFPELVNPDTGFVQACGSPPWLATTGLAEYRGAWPNWLVRDADSYRAKRVRRLLAQEPRDLAEHQAILFDRVVPIATFAVPFLLESAETLSTRNANFHADLPAFLATLSEWDYLADENSYGMTCFHVWWSLIRRDNDGVELPPESIHALMEEGPEWFRWRALETASRAAMLMRNAYQSISVPWGEAHVLVRGERREALGGGMSGEPIFVSGDTVYDGYRWPATSGFGFAMTVELDDMPRAYTVVPFGASERQGSKHYDDQVDLMTARRLKRAHYVRRDVERYAEQAIGTYAALRVPENDARAWVSSASPMSVGLRTATGGLTLPNGLAPYSRFVETDVSGHAAVGVDIEFGISRDVAADAALRGLGVYRFDPRMGWQGVPEQRWAGDRRVLQARAGRPGVFAVLGPADTRLNPIETATPMQVDLPPTPASFRDANENDWRLAEADPSRRPRPPVEDEEALDLLPEDLSRVAAAPRPVATERDLQGPRVNFPAETDDTSAFGRNRGGAMIPNLPPGWTPEAIMESQRAMIGEHLPPPPPPARPNATPIRGTRSRESAPESSASRSNELETVAEAELEAPELEAAPAPPSVAEPAEELEKVRETARAMTARENSTVLFSDLTPRDLKEDAPNVDVDDFSLTDNPSLASPLVSGTKLELRPPAAGIMFRMTMRSPVMAQATLVDLPEEPFPDGLVNFTPVVRLAHNPPQAAGNTALTMQVQPGIVAPENIPNLKIYTHDRLNGWQPLERQKAPSADGLFSGIDMQARTYAVLGPAAHQLQVPAY